MAPPSSFRRWTRRPGRFFAAAFLGTVALVGVERGVSAWRAERAEPLPGARWIWAPELDAVEVAAADGGSINGGARPVAFYAVRDVDLGGGVPAGAGAWISVAADESYYLYVNGRYVGAGSYHPGMAVDRYAVRELFQPGPNRIVVELRSSRGIGGLLAEVTVGAADGGERPAAVTDGGWRIHRRHFPELFHPTAELPPGEPARVWGPSPTGRWRVRPADGLRPIPFRDGAPAERRSPVRMRSPQPGSPWFELTWPRRGLPRTGPQILLDWGREVEGFLYLDLTSDEAPPGLLYVGSEPPDPLAARPDEVMIFMPGLAQWRALRPRRFRYALLVGVEPRRQIEVRLVGPKVARRLAPPPPPATGVFGVLPTRRHTPAEELVWRRLTDSRSRSP